MPDTSHYQPHMSVVMTDHPAWLAQKGGRLRMWRRVDGCIQEATVTDAGRWVAGSSSDQDPQIIASISESDQESSIVVRRWATTDLWEAIAAGIVRQVIRADQARKLYSVAAQRLGDEYTPSFRGFPSAQQVLLRPVQDFVDCGLAFQVPKLKAAAEWYVAAPAAPLELDVLANQLGEIPGIGPWSVGVIIADISNDFAWYPYDDLAVRRGAQRLWPDYGFPDKPGAFARRWAEFAGKNLAEFTAVALSGIASL
ncbi:hypothetical protein CMUST_12435 [Corynebacterium mustelae]|uniref:3-methyladenine DNA glycosylase/8-oxoguanine DNA glycosylase n=1 Tax=Corynebacterium mustelae TaxID=571915 RepID=A0A0G3H4P3_9CORY|nr:hypothetical protein [Corynebacterium mustelae]AKK06793.1 hypothetical protein CMUST_12435 [Corynebacterium mustelae]